MPKNYRLTSVCRKGRRVVVHARYIHASCRIPINPDSARYRLFVAYLSLKAELWYVKLHNQSITINSGGRLTALYKPVSLAGCEVWLLLNSTFRPGFNPGLVGSI